MVIRDERVEAAQQRDRWRTRRRRLLSGGRDVGVRVTGCLVCGAPVQSYPGVVRCTSCGLEVLDPSPSDDELDRAYATAYGEDGTKFRGSAEVVLRIAADRMARHIHRSLPKHARIVDVGCGRGVVAGALAHRGCSVVGVERSLDAVHGLDPRVEVCIAPNLAEANLEPASFDAVVCRHVLEHLRDPVGSLEAMRRLLKPGGVLFLEVPNVESVQSRVFRDHWLHRDPPRHLTHFTPAALRALLLRTGFAIDELRSRFSVVQGPFGWTQSLLNAAGQPRDRLYASVHAGSRDSSGYAIALTTAPLAVAAAALETVVGRGVVLAAIARRPV